MNSTLIEEPKVNFLLSKPESGKPINYIHSLSPIIKSPFQFLPCLGPNLPTRRRDHHHSLLLPHCRRRSRRRHRRHRASASLPSADRGGLGRGLSSSVLHGSSPPPMGVVIEREEWALTPLAYPLLSAASLAAVLLLPYFSPPSHATAAASPSSHSPFDVGTTPFLRFRRGFLFVFSLASGKRSPPFTILPCSSQRAGGL